MNEVKASFHCKWKTSLDSGNNKVLQKKKPLLLILTKVQSDYALIRDDAAAGDS